MEEKKNIPETIEEYIAGFPDDIQPKLNEIRDIIRKNAPEAKEKISWGMPTFTQKKNLVHFSGNKHHVGFYPGVEAIEVFKDKLTEYKTSKGAIQFPYSKPLPEKLISEIVKYQIDAIINVNN